MIDYKYKYTKYKLKYTQLINGGMNNETKTQEENKLNAKNKFLNNLNKKRVLKNIKLENILKNVLRKMNFSHFRLKPRRIQRTLSGNKTCTIDESNLIHGCRLLGNYAYLYLIKKFTDNKKIKKLLKNKDFGIIIIEYLVSKISGIGYCGTAVVKSIIYFFQENYCDFIKIVETNENNGNNHTYLLLPKTNNSSLDNSELIKTFLKNNNYLELLDYFIIYDPLHNFVINKDNDFEKILSFLIKQLENYCGNNRKQEIIYFKNYCLQINPLEILNIIYNYINFILYEFSKIDVESIIEKMYIINNSRIDDSIFKLLEYTHQIDYSYFKLLKKKFVIEFRR